MGETLGNFCWRTFLSFTEGFIEFTEGFGARQEALIRVYAELLEEMDAGQLPELRALDTGSSPRQKCDFLPVSFTIHL